MLFSKALWYKRGPYSIDYLDNQVISGNQVFPLFLCFANDNQQNDSTCSQA